MLSNINKVNNSDLESFKDFNKSFILLKKEISKVIIGQEKIIDELLVTLLSSGHCLLVGVPGLAKTLLIKTLAEVLDLKFSRIQFTPDLMPSDVTGTEIIENNISTGQKSFRFVKGPIFTNILLADEINRTPPKTQSALLESMQEHRVTAAGDMYTLSEPFFVLATQNPIEQEGTYPLPEAQLDRFMFCLWLDYPSHGEEVEIVKMTTSMYQSSLTKIFNAEDIIRYQHLVRGVPVSDNLVKYAVNLVTSSRPKNNNSPKFIQDWITWGAGPRASQYLILAAKAKALIDGRFSPEIDDIKNCAIHVLRHRLVLNFNAEADNIRVEDIIARMVNEIK